MGTCVRLTGRVPDNPQVDSTLTVTLPDRCENGKNIIAKMKKCYYTKKILLHRKNVYGGITFKGRNK